MVADVAKLAAGREDYYTRELATDHQQHLSGRGESPGRWHGQGSAFLGLEGEASVAGFRRMFEGRHPDTGALLGRPHGEGGGVGASRSAEASPKAKVLADAFKLSFAATLLDRRPRLLLLFSDESAAAPFRSPRTWSAAAIREAGIEVAAVTLPDEEKAKIREAQQRQYR